MTSDLGASFLVALLLFGAFSKVRNASNVSKWTLVNLGRAGRLVGARTLALADLSVALVIFLLPSYSATVFASLAIGAVIFFYHLWAGARSCPCFGGDELSTNKLPLGAAVVVILLSARDLLAMTWTPLLATSETASIATSSLALFVGAWFATTEDSAVKEDEGFDMGSRRGDLQDVNGSETIYKNILRDTPGASASIFFGDLRCSSCISLAKKYTAISGLSSSHQFYLDLGRPITEGTRMGMARIITLQRELKTDLGINVSPTLMILIGTKYEIYRGKQECNAALIKLIPE